MGKSTTPVAKPGAFAYQAKSYSSMEELNNASKDYERKKAEAGYAEQLSRGRGPIRDNTGLRDPLDPSAPKVEAPALPGEAIEQGVKDRIYDPNWLAKDKAATLEGQAIAKQKNTERDQALMAGGMRKLMEKRVFDLARVRNRSSEYKKPELGGDMMGVRKRLLGQ